MITLSIFGCIENQTSQEQDNEEELLSEIDSFWIEEGELGMESSLTTDNDIIAAEMGTQVIEETEEIEIGEMI